MNANSKCGKNNILKICVTMIAAVMIFTVLFTGCKNKKGYVLKVDGEKITSEQFAFFCSLVLEDEAFTYTAFYDTTVNFTEAVKEEAKNFAQEYICRYHEAVKNGFSLSEEQKESILKAADDEYKKYTEEYGIQLEEGDYYDFFYGITKKEYLSFREKWTVIDIYNDDEYEKADISEEAQRASYEKYKSFLNTKLTKIIVLDISEKDSEEKRNAEEFAQLILNKAKNGEDFDGLMKQYSDDEELTEAGGEVHIGASFQTLYPNLYKWSENASVGDMSMIKETDAIYIVKCIDITEFEDIVNTDEMIQYTQFDNTQTKITQLLALPKYEIVLDKKEYEACDISDLVSQAIEYWTSLWEVYGFPATS